MAMSRVDPERIAPKLLNGRFERKIFVDNPSDDARRALILRQLAEEVSEHMLTPEDVGFIVEKTAGRSAVNMERLISSAAICAAGVPVSRDDFLTALEEEPSDFDRLTAARNAKYDQKHGWHPV
jgi:SpoVK/Ycf46/Vps4 family AAA+-type ATPase